MDSDRRQASHLQAIVQRLVVLVLQGYAGDQAAEESGIAVSHAYVRPVYARSMSTITIVRYQESLESMEVPIIGAAGKQDAGG